MLTFTLEGAEQLATDWVNVRAAVRAGMRRGVKMGVEEAAEEARRTHQFKNRSEDGLEKAIVGRLVGNAEDEQKGELAALKSYASFVEEGRGPVVASPGKVLRFEIDGEVFYRKRVRAAKARPFLGPAYMKCERVIVREIERGVAQAQAILDR